MTTAASAIETRVDGHIAEIIFNRPDKHNSIDEHVHFELKDAFAQMRDTPGVRVILFGARGKSFSAGGSFDEMLAHKTDRARRLRMAAEARPVLMMVADCPLPVVTALQGDAIGLGATLILASDAIVAARTARIADPHVVIGLCAGDGGVVAWPLHTGLLRAKRYLLTGDRIKAEDALAMGLVTDLVDTPEEALPAARALATRIAALPPLAVQHTKRALNQIFRQRMDAVFEYGFQLELETMISDDLGEAVAAFREKRTPSYTGQ